MAKNLRTLSISVVVPHRGNDESLEVCIDAVRKQTFPRSKTEILIVINEPENRAVSFELHENEKVLWEPDYFSYAARNLGIVSSIGSIIALTDSDTVPDPGWLSEGFSIIQAGADLAAGAIQLTFTRQRLTSAACYEKLYAFDQEKNVRFMRSATANLFARKDLFLKQGLFAEYARSGGDFAWTRRVAEAGGTITFAEKARVLHPARESWVELSAKARRVATPNPIRARGFWLDSLRHYLSVYLAPPSKSKWRACSLREIVLGNFAAVIVQTMKMLFFCEGLKLDSALRSDAVAVPTRLPSRQRGKSKTRVRWSK
jgi:GT2 family glycosyltransferase